VQPLSDTSPTLLRRAYQLARSGMCKNLGEIGRRLKHEGYGANNVDEVLEAKAPIRADLVRILDAVEKT
jgi:hypothetical protein